MSVNAPSLRDAYVATVLEAELIAGRHEAVREMSREFRDDARAVRAETACVRRQARRVRDRSRAERSRDQYRGVFRGSGRSEQLPSGATPR